METNHAHNILDSVLTLRGHQVTLRQAVAEGIIKCYFDPETGKTEVVEDDTEWYPAKARQRIRPS